MELDTDFFVAHALGGDAAKACGKSIWIPSNDVILPATAAYERAGPATAQDERAGRLQLADFYRSDVSFSRVDRGLKALEDGGDFFSTGFDDAFSFDIPLEQEAILSQGPEAATVPQIYATDIPSPLSDCFQYSPTSSSFVDWNFATSAGDPLDGMALVGPLDQLGQTIFLGSGKLSEDDEFLLDQLAGQLQTQTYAQYATTTTWDSDMGDSQCWSSSNSSQCTTAECSPAPASPSPYSPPTTETTTPLIQTTFTPAPQKKVPGPAPAPCKSPRRPYTRKRPAASPSPSLSMSSSSTSTKKSVKVTPKKRTQNRKAAGDYRTRKRLIEEEQAAEHEQLLKVRDELRELNEQLTQELKFAVKMAEARLKRMTA
ncbi:hypothetical protein BV898_02814 [Hypsibius exemplaris]|uniref:BZIP domain-containing protein n=1 Tax=Hypsibius exemplaris TaxID=2072580 RepID=A0A1W0X7I3_HYPEX|nr:hypothetical protein BV898_02814 [Hypsibius exemplaris]